MRSCTGELVPIEFESRESETSVPVTRELVPIPWLFVEWFHEFEYLVTYGLLTPETYDPTPFTIEIWDVLT